MSPTERQPGEHPLVDGWFASRGWDPFPFQRDAWRAHNEGRSGLIHAPTGNGKTLAAMMGPLIDWLRSDEGVRLMNASEAGDDPEPPPLRLLWLTPMRALANDTLESLKRPILEMGVPWSCEKRTGDTGSAAKARQRRKMPTLLVTTPESLTILLSYADGPALFKGLRGVVVDEWHELLGTKRGVQTELALSRLRAINPDRGTAAGLRTWGLSATLGNTEEAARALVGVRAEEPVLVRGIAPKAIEVDCVIPPTLERFPWAGHIGTGLMGRVVDRIRGAGTSLLFTNTRAQAEIWFRDMMRAHPELLGRVALHHGSLDRQVRERVEEHLRARDSILKCVVCTSSLDLGVDFSPVDQVIQVGSPKGVARLIQRAGRSGHQPGAVSRVVCVPTNALELVEFASAREAIERGVIEQRTPVPKPLDVLTQHLVTAAMGGGFEEDSLRREVASCYAYRDLTDREWSWAMAFVHRGGESLGAYPEFARIGPAEDDGSRWTVASKKIAIRHRMGIGTIVGDQAVAVKYANGRTLGTIEESFVSKLRNGNRFVFAGKPLELVRLRQMTATVRPARSTRGAIARWGGGKMPLSTQLSDAVRARIAGAARGVYEGPEMEAVRPLLELQAALSRLPAADEVLIETITLKDGFHAFVFPFGGRLAHEGLGAVLSLRLSRLSPASITAVGNDYGIELVTDDPIELDEAGWRRVLSPEDLVADLLESVNESELARRQFREVARIAGLTSSGYPGERVSSRHTQASSDMFFDVFAEFDPENLLLDQARREVVEGQLEVQRLVRVLEACAQRKLVIVRPETVTPLGFGLFAESIRATTVSSETWEDRIRRMSLRFDREADAIADGG